MPTTVFHRIVLAHAGRTTPKEFVPQIPVDGIYTTHRDVEDKKGCNRDGELLEETVA
ncbi:MAG: hypothetical protein U9N62_06350 [Thermotogota bacterium]|nr:hypothetical protein [Thermotogota bacterium]